MFELKQVLICCSLLAVAIALPNRECRPDPKHTRNLGTRIVGGEPAKQGEIPHQILLEYCGYLHCGGSLIIVNNTQIVLTAAHCVDDFDDDELDDFTATAGDLNRTDTSGHEQRRIVKQIILHEDFNWITYENDIALLVIDRPYVINENVVPIALPEKGKNTTGDVLVSGWGDLKLAVAERPDVLQKVQLPLIDDVTCQKSYPEMNITSSMICAGFLEEGGKDSCGGDSGGPLGSINEGYLAGIVSWGFGCAEPGRPGVNTEVSYFIDWIENHVGRL